MNSYKTLNYHAFRAIIRSVANEVIVDNPCPVEVGSISRRHWNDLKEPTVKDLKDRAGKKKKKIRSKSLAAKRPLQERPNKPCLTPLILRRDLRNKLELWLQ